MPEKLHRGRSVRGEGNDVARAGTRAPGRRTLAGRLPIRPAGANSGRRYLRQLLGEKLRDPAGVQDGEIRATAEYGSYMDHNLVWQWQLHVTDAEALAACRLVLTDLAAGQSVSWPGDARKYIYAVRAIGTMTARPAPDGTSQDPSRQVGPIGNPAPQPEPDPQLRGPVSPQDPEPREPDAPSLPEHERRIVTPTIDPEDGDSFRKRIDDAGRWLEDLKRRGDKLADELERHVERARDLFAAVSTVFAAGVVLMVLPNKEYVAVTIYELSNELDEIDRIRRDLLGDDPYAWPSDPPKLPATPQEAEALKSAGYRWDNDFIRNYYNDTVQTIGPQNEMMKAAGVTAERRARMAYDVRHNARMTCRAMMLPEERLGLEQRDAEKPAGLVDGPTFEGMMAEAKATGRTGDDVYEWIIQKAQTTDAGYNAKYGRGSRGDQK